MIIIVNEPLSCVFIISSVKGIVTLFEGIVAECFLALFQIFFLFYSFATDSL